MLLKLHEKLLQNSSTMLWSLGIWSKLERWKRLISGCLVIWPKIKKFFFWKKKKVICLKKKNLSTVIESILQKSLSSNGNEFIPGIKVFFFLKGVILILCNFSCHEAINSKKSFCCSILELSGIGNLQMRKMQVNRNLCPRSAEYLYGSAYNHRFSTVDCPVDVVLAAKSCPTLLQPHGL